MAKSQKAIIKFPPNTCVKKAKSRKRQEKLVRENIEEASYEESLDGGLTVIADRNSKVPNKSSAHRKDVKPKWLPTDDQIASDPAACPQTKLIVPIDDALLLQTQESLRLAVVRMRGDREWVTEDHANNLLRQLEALEYSGERHLGCPFAQLYPCLGTCSGGGFKAIGDLNQHILRNHAFPQTGKPYYFMMTRSCFEKWDSHMDSSNGSFKHEQFNCKDPTCSGASKRLRNTQPTSSKIYWCDSCDQKRRSQIMDLGCVVLGQRFNILLKRTPAAKQKFLHLFPIPSNPFERQRFIEQEAKKLVDSHGREKTLMILQQSEAITALRNQVSQHMQFPLDGTTNATGPGIGTHGENNIGMVNGYSTYNLFMDQGILNGEGGQFDQSNGTDMTPQSIEELGRDGIQGTQGQLQVGLEPLMALPNGRNSFFTPTPISSSLPDALSTVVPSQLNPRISSSFSTNMPTNPNTILSIIPTGTPSINSDGFVSHLSSEQPSHYRHSGWVRPLPLPLPPVGRQAWSQAGGGRFDTWWQNELVPINLEEILQRMYLEQSSMGR